MNIIIISFIIGILFVIVAFFMDAILEITKISNYDEKVAFALKWFFYIAILNVIIMTLVLYYNYYMKSEGLVGSVGSKGFTGSKGSPAPDCITTYCIKNNILLI